MENGVFLAILQRITDAFLTQDMDEIARHYALPLIMETRTDTYVIADLEALTKDCHIYFVALQANRVTDIIRELFTVQQTEPDTIQGTYRTHIMAGATRITEPYTSVMTLRQIDGQWRVKKIANALGHNDWT